MHYLEHARHKFLKAEGIDFAEWVAKGIHFVIFRVELDFRKPLRSGDRFWVGINMERISRLRFGLLQDVYRLPDNEPILNARVVGTVMNDHGRPKLPRELEAIMPK